MNDLISVIIPAHNCGAYLWDCVQSLLEQTYPHFEAIVVDDGSEDDTRKICGQIRRQDSRIRIFHQENRGVSEARNRGMELAGGAAADPEFEADVCAGPAEFLGYIRHASFVATNSFHAAAFSLIFQKEFLVFAHSSRNARLENILAACGLGDRLIREGEEAPVPARPVCWDGVAERIRQMAGKSRAYLVRALTGGQQENGEDRHTDGAV